MSVRKGHYWLWHLASTSRLVVLRWAEGRPPEESFGETPPVRATLVWCDDCGIVSAHHDRVDAEGRPVRVVAYGADEDSLTLRGSPPTCDRWAFSRHPAETVAAEAA